MHHDFIELQSIEQGTHQPIENRFGVGGDGELNKLLDRGSLSATTLVTNVQDFITIVAKGLGLM